jgi:hypothetical protein
MTLGPSLQAKTKQANQSLFQISGKMHKIFSPNINSSKDGRQSAQQASPVE